MSVEFADYDMEWIGVDARGYLARFTTAGHGWIPSLLQSYSIEEIEGGLEFMESLPAVSKAGFTKARHVCRDFEVCCEKGIFVYDWTSVHRVTPHNKNAYELVAIPTKPIFASSALSKVVQPFAVTLEKIEFLKTPYIIENN